MSTKQKEKHLGNGTNTRTTRILATKTNSRPELYKQELPQELKLLERRLWRALGVTLPRHECSDQA